MRRAALPRVTGMSDDTKKEGAESTGREECAPPRIVLPFDLEKRKRDLGEEVYDRRKPIFITVIVYLALILIFFSSKVVLQRREVATAIMMNLEEMDRLIRELEEEKKEKQRTPSLAEVLAEMDANAGEPVRNVASSEEGEAGEPEAARPLSASTEDFVRQAQEIERRMRSNREAYEAELMAGQREYEEKQQQQQERGFEDPRAKPIKVEGKVTVYYSLKNPDRAAANLFVPAYQCRKGGRVVVDVVVSGGGDVVSASVVKPFSTDDWCMHETAVKAAYKSKFVIHPGAPPQHQGRIIYTFVPQN